MNKSELIEAISIKAGVKKSDAEAVFLATFEVISESLANQEKVVIPKFGNFSTKVREKRKGRNPATGKELIIPKAIVANFKVASQLKDSINNQEE